MNKIILFLLAALLAAPAAKAQLYPGDSTFLMQTFLNTPYIFEGTVLYSESYEASVDGGTPMFTSHIIDVQKVFRGNLACGTVEFITRGGVMGNRGSTSDGMLNMGPGGRAIIFADASAFPDHNASVTNPVVLSAVFEHQMGIIDIVKENGDDARDMAVYGFWTNWQHLTDFYAYLESMPNISRVDCPQPAPSAHVVVQENKEGGTDLLSVYPNPTDGVLTIEQEVKKEGIVFLKVIDTNGKTVMTPMQGIPYPSYDRVKQILNISFLPAGIYRIELSVTGEVIGTATIIKR